ncbi:protein kinase [Streptomyces sp. Y2F8-2]|uniref:protein kinase domain-containing protein n=1 Tax=Streptomyces sp. Y2F8-2 TaxID=2759675 RepID=UPI001907FBF4|nr:protein kinase [Streptomyces sp. Y2F8-2]
MEPLREGDPERIGGHELFARLGEGGWGTVYFARTSRGRSIALKTIRPACLEEDPERFRKRFAREVEAAKAVDPRHTAEVVDSDTRAAEPWFASRYIPGVNLAEALDHCGNPLPQRTWRVLAAGLVDALRSIHRAGLVHRDLKLANVLLGADGAYVIDFGIARHLSPTDGTTLTRTGTSPRTTSFASPEQLRDERVGWAGDIFALGLVLAYTALNRHPFGTGSPMEIAANIVIGRPSLDGLPPAVEKVVRPCLEPEPGNRPGPAEIADLLAAEASPTAQDWLPPGLRARIDQRSRFAIDIDRPLRPGRSSPRAAGPTPAPAARSSSGLTTDPTPPEARSAPNARLLRERDLEPAPAGQTETEKTTRPAAAAPGKKDTAGPGDTEARMRASAQAGNAEAMRWVAAHCKNTGDLEAALLWYRRAADAGNATAAREAGQLLEKHFPRRRAEVLALYQRASDAGELFARTRLTRLLAQEQDKPGLAPKAEPTTPPKAAAAAGGNAEAPGGDGTAQSGGAAGVPAPVSAAEQELLRQHRTAAMNGKINSVLALADWYRQQNRDQDALVWYWRGAEGGHPHCMFVTSVLLAKDPRREGESLRWLRAAADAGNTAALHRLGQRVEKDRRPADALRFFRSAAEKGHAPSILETARLLEQSAQPVQALEWFVRAAAKGSAAAAEEADRIRAELRRNASSPPPSGEQSPKAAPPRKKTSSKAAPASGTTNPTGAKTRTATTATATKTTRPNASVLRREAERHEREGRLHKALDSYAQAAEQLGDTASKRDVARLCLSLSGSAESPEERRRFRKRAVRLYRKLAQDGDPQSIRALAELGLTVDSREQNTKQLQTQLEAQLQAAGEGSSKAMRQVARTYLRLGSEEHVQAALAWLRRAGEMNNTGAMLDAARVCEERGQHREALEWYCWARDSGDGAAVAHIERLAADHPGAALMTRLSRRLRRAWT